LSQTFSRIFGLSHHLAGQRVKSSRDPRDTRFLFSAILASLALVSVLFLYIWCRLAVVGMGYEISQANTDRNALVEQNRRLKIEYLHLKSPRRIEAIAIEELGLVHPSEGQIIRVGK